jgi:hypothetical protein
VLESLILISGSKPVRISQRPSKIIPTLLLRMLLVRLICVLHSPRVENGWGLKLISTKTET